MNQDVTSSALLLIAHGSRRPEANADLHWLAEELRQHESFNIVVCSYLELAEPTIEAGAEQCVAEGVRRVVLVPYFLSPGVHVTEDLETTQQVLQQRYPQIEFVLAEPLGRHPLMVQMVAERARQAAARLPGGLSI